MGKKRKLDQSDSKYGDGQQNPPSTKRRTVTSPAKVAVPLHHPESSPAMHKAISSINVERFVQSRAVEIQAMTEVIQNTGGNHMAFQKLPRHMRRRAMSHNLKRIPRRLRDVVKSEIQKTKAPTKRPSRRYRRRPSNLLSDYERRKRKIGWLETHIWHAKRFKMTQKWGYRLPLHPSDKSIRACYRAVSRHCLMQDVSYETFIEVCGPREEIVTGLSHVVSSQTGLTFASKMYSSGSRQGSVVLYSYDSYPHGCIGRVSFMWRPVEQSVGVTSDNSVLWISCHPSFVHQALSEIKTCFSTGQETDKKVDSGSSVSVSFLKDELIIFRLFGPASNQVLSEVLKPACVKDTESAGSQTSGDTVSEEKKWWKECYKSSGNASVHDQQVEAVTSLSSCHSPSVFPPACILSLTVRDPRLLLPPKRNKVSVYSSDASCPLRSEMFSPEVSTSPLWDKDVRQRVKAHKIPEHKLNEMRSQQLIPGSALDLGQSESRVPVMLVQRPGSSSPAQQPGKQTAKSQVQQGFSSGWDLILPAGWAMAFWVALVYRGARTGGLREARSLALQGSQLIGPHDFPDSSAGHGEMDAEVAAKQLRHDKRPPAKRPNYIKLGFPHPFTFPFQQLVEEWVKMFLGKWDNVCQGVPQSMKGKILDQLNSPGCKFHVLRDRKALRFLHQTVNGSEKKRNVKASRKNGSLAGKSVNIYEELSKSECGRQFLETELFSLVPVYLSNVQRGVPATLAHVYVPTQEDLDKDVHTESLKEDLHKDPTAAQRKAERRERLKLRKKKKRGEKVGSKASSINKTGSDQANEKEKASKRMSSIEDKAEDILPEKASMQVSATLETGCKDQLKDPDTASTTAATKTTDSGAETVTSDKQMGSKAGLENISLLSHSQRAVMGVVRTGDFNLSTGQGCAVAFVSTAALLQLLNEGRTQHNTVLVRNITSLQYRKASLQVLM